MSKETTVKNVRWDARDQKVVEITEHGIWRTICENNWQYPNDAEARKYTNIIAAALEMLEACEASEKYQNAIVRRAQDGQYEIAARGAIAKGVDLDSLFDDWMKKTEVALKKARGEQS